MKERVERGKEMLNLMLNDGLGDEEYMEKQGKPQLKIGKIHSQMNGKKSPKTEQCCIRNMYQVQCVRKIYPDPLINLQVSLISIIFNERYRVSFLIFSRFFSLCDTSTKDIVMPNLPALTQMYPSHLNMFIMPEFLFF